MSSQRFDEISSVQLAQRMKFDLNTQVCQKTANARVLLSQDRRLFWVLALERWQKKCLFGLEMLEELALEATPSRLADRPITAMDVIEQAREELVETLMVGKEEVAGSR